MAAPIIRSVGSSSGTVTGVGRNNLVIGETVTLSDTVVGNIGLPHSWSLLDRPIGSSSTLTTPAGATSTFVPDVTGSYFVKCTVNGLDIAYVIIAVPLARTGARIPAFTEELQYNGGSNTKGWHEAMTVLMRAADSMFITVGGQIGGTAAAPYITGLRETSGPTLLTFGAMTSGYPLARIGSTVATLASVPAADFATVATSASTATFATTAGGAPPTGAASGQLGGSFPSPDVRGLRETSGPTLLTMGAVPDGKVFARSGSTIVGVAGGHSIQDDGGVITTRSILNFKGAVQAVDAGAGPDRIDVDLEDTAVTPATYARATITVDQKGRITSAAASTTGLIGTSGDTIVRVVPAAGRDDNDSTTTKVIGAFSFDPSQYALGGTTRSIIFRAVAAAGNSTVIARVKLWNATDSVYVTTLTFTGNSATQKQDSAALVVPTDLPNSAKIYEVHAFVDTHTAGSDLIVVYSASLVVTQTVT
jgi:hypothetical protein